jgi:hypothetical protein
MLAERPWRAEAKSGTRFARARWLRSLATPLVIALPPLFWVANATVRASLTTLGRDQGIFQYVARALQRGAVDYRDVRDVNGPLTHLVHLVILALGGADEHRFRVLDLIVTGATFAFVGACLPGLRGRPAPDALERAGWAAAAWVVLSGQYLLYGYWDTAQRESFFDWFILPSIALQLLAQAPRPNTGAPRRQQILLATAGALSVVPWFGKPTYALFTCAQLVALFADDKLAVRRTRAVAAFAAGGALGAATQLGFVLACGDLHRYLQIQLWDVPAVYRFIWPRAAADILSNPWCATQGIYAIVGTIVTLALIVYGQMPRRALALAVFPCCALASVLLQAKGFPYHFHPVTAGVHLQWLFFAVWLNEKARVAARRRAMLRLAPVAAGVVIALRVATSMEDSPYIRAVWLLWGAATPEDRATPQYFAHFAESDFFPYELRQTAEYLRLHTRTDERIQTYGMDPYVLFLADRLSATPYVYAYDLNVDSALHGGTGGRPDSKHAARIRSIRDEHEADMLARLTARPPAAFVFLDNAPLMSRADAMADFASHCQASAEWMRPRYVLAANFGHDHVWLRRDLASREAAPDLSPGDTVPDLAPAEEP